MATHSRRPQVVIFPFPTAGHLNPMLDLAKLLHLQGFYITFINTQYCHHRVLKSGGGCDELKASDHFQLETIPDGYFPAGSEPFDFRKLLLSIEVTCPAPFGELLQKLNSSFDVLPIACIITNFLVTFVADAAAEIGVPSLLFWPASACSLMTEIKLPELVRRGYTPLKDQSYLTNGYLDTSIDWIPGMKDIRLRDLLSFIRTTDPDDMILETQVAIANYVIKASGLILNTFDHLESEVLEALKGFFPRMYVVGPLVMLLHQIKENPSNSMRFNLWEEDHSWKEWLNNQRVASVFYVSFGSLTTLRTEQVMEFAWGLADSKQPFLWIFRPNLLDGGIAALPEEFIKETQGRSFFASWCPQVEVLSHPAIGGFLMHGGWNSMVESICAGVPIICWPGFADQFTNCRYACKEWGIGMEIDEEVKREQVKELVTELIEGEGGQQIRKNTMKWKEKAEQATTEGGTSFTNLEMLAKDIHTK